MAFICLNIANTGKKLYPKVEIYVDGIPYGWTEDLCIKTDAFPVGEKYDQETNDKILLEKKKYDGSVVFLIHEMPPGWNILIYVCEPKIEFEKRDWSNTVVELKGTGSILNESPIKVLITNKIQKYSSYIIIGIKKVFNILFNW